jgi:hypothetical protein
VIAKRESARKDFGVFEIVIFVKSKVRRNSVCPILALPHPVSSALPLFDMSLFKPHLDHHYHIMSLPIVQRCSYVDRDLTRELIQFNSTPICHAPPPPDPILITGDEHVDWVRITAIPPPIIQILLCLFARPRFNLSDIAKDMGPGNFTYQHAIRVMAAVSKDTRCMYSWLKEIRGYWKSFSPDHQARLRARLTTSLSVRPSSVGHRKRCRDDTDQSMTKRSRFFEPASIACSTVTELQLREQLLDKAMSNLKNEREAVEHVQRMLTANCRLLMAQWMRRHPQETLDIFRMNLPQAIEQLMKVDRAGTTRILSECLIEAKHEMTRKQ